MTSRLQTALGLVLALSGSALPVNALAQNIGYGNVASGGEEEAEAGSSSGRRGAQKRTSITPYIEASQVVTAELSPGNDVLTYSQVAAGVEGTVVSRNAGASMSLRYERRFGYGNASDSDAISGVARGYVKLSKGFQIDAGALAGRTRIEGDGASVLGPLGDNDAVTQVYSIYAGPSVKTRMGGVEVQADYKIGYSRVESPDAIITAPGQSPVDVFDSSVSHMASVHAGTKAGDMLPVGVGVGANYYREDISNLDQRVEDKAARADLTLPVGQDLSLVGGVGYEDVSISARDAVRDADGNPVIGEKGRFVTDKSAARVLSYDTSGLIWDAGVIWRPSRRTALEAHVGRRYGGTTVYGSFAYSPNARSALNVSVYDNVAGFGGQMTRTIAGLPTEFRTVRSPLTNDVSGCVSSVQGGEGVTGNCLGGALGSVRSSTFRAKGVMASYSLDLGSLSTGVGLGYDRRKFIAARGTVLAAANGVVDENIWAAAYLAGRIDNRSTFSTNLYANWFQSGSGLNGDVSAVGATASYSRRIISGLSATAALGIDGVSRDELLEDEWTASALLGLRYSF